MLSVPTCQQARPLVPELVRVIETECRGFQKTAPCAERERRPRVELLNFLLALQVADYDGHPDNTPPVQVLHCQAQCNVCGMHKYHAVRVCNCRILVGRSPTRGRGAATNQSNPCIHLARTW